jgi:iron complex outermembrane receptor protein
MKTCIFNARLAVLPLALAAAFSAVAQTQLKEVVVVASRFEELRLNAPTLVQVITQADIQNSGALSIPDVLRMLVAVNIRSVSSGQLEMNSTVDLGGFGATATQNTLILVDGRRMNPIDASEIAWSSVNLSSIQRIEVASGASGVQYGAGATGGVINIITDGKKVDRTQVELSVGSFGSALLGFNLERQVNDLFVSLSAGANRNEGWRENSQAESQNLAVKVIKQLDSKAQVFAEILASQQTNGFPGGVLGQVGEGDQKAAKFNNVGSENTLTQSGLRLGGFKALTERTTLDVDVVFGKRNSNFKQPYYDTSDSFNTTYGSLSGSGTSRLVGDDRSFSPKFRTEYANGSTLVYGYDFSRSQQNGANAFGPLAQQFILNNQGPFSYQGNILSDTQSVELNNQSAYIISRSPLNQSLDLSVGARRQIQGYDTFDQNKLSGIQGATGSFGANAYETALNYKLDETSRTFFRLNQSYRFANTDEYWGYDANGSRVFSGELRPQITRGFEIGYDYKAGRQQLSVMFGQSVTSDEIRYNSSLYRNSNLSDDVTRSSLSAIWSAQVLPKSHLSVTARLQKAEYMNGEFAGQSLGLVPNAIYNLGWTQEIDGQTRAGLQVTHVSAQNYDADPTTAQSRIQMPDYTTADAFVAHSFGKLEAKLTIKNLTGTTYATYGGYGFVSTPGASGMSSYYYFPSDPRSLFLSINYRF